MDWREYLARRDQLWRDHMHQSAPALPESLQAPEPPEPPSAPSPMDNITDQQQRFMSPEELRNVGMDNWARFRREQLGMDHTDQFGHDYGMWR